MDAAAVFIIFLLIALAIVVINGIRIVSQFERGIVLRLGKYKRTLNPGLNVVNPFFDKVIKVDVRTRPMDIPKQEVITKDNVTVNVDAVVYSKVINPQKAVLETTDFAYATKHRTSFRHETCHG